MEKIIYHVDVNSAFLSWEASYRVNVLGEALDLRTVPSAIGGSEKDRHGIILAKSTEAKRYGIQTGEPLVSARKKCPNLIIAAPNYPMYTTASKALIRLLYEFSPDIHQYSIDEAFVDMTGTDKLFGSPAICAHMIKDKIKKELGFTVNIGISSNKLLAKMASDFKKPDLVHTLFPFEIKEKMWHLPVSDLFFVGRASEHKLRNYGIRTIGELAKADPAFIKSILKSHGLLIWEFANGIADQMDKFTLNPTNKGYGNSMTIPFDITTKEDAKAVLLSLTETVAARIRADHAFISVVSVSIVDFNFAFSSKQSSLNAPTDITRQIYETACTIFDTMWDYTPIRQLGVHTSKATSAQMYQYSFLDNYSINKEIGLDKTIDNIRTTWGEDAIIRGKSLSMQNSHALSHMAGGLDKTRRSGITKGITTP